jgi:hypothetical protein
MNRYLILISILLLGLTACKRQTLEERIQAEAALFTQKNCPKQVDKFTVMDSCVFSIPERTYYYNYTVKGDLDVDSIYTQDLYEAFREDLLSGIKGSITLKACKDAGVSFCYRYYSDRSGKLLMMQKFTKKDYR